MDWSCCNCFRSFVRYTQGSKNSLINRMTQKNYKFEEIKKLRKMEKRANKRGNGKRGTLTQTTIISLIIVILAGAVLFIVMNNVINKKQLDKDACNYDVNLRNNEILKGTHWTPEMFPLRCKTENIEVKTMDETTIKRTLANAMYDCWWMLGEGKADFFTPDSWWELSNPLNVEEANCVVCSTIKFDDKVKAKNMQIDLAPYLEETVIPIKNMTYLEFFLDAPGAKFEAGESNKISTSEDYALIYMALKGEGIGRTLGEAGATGAVSGMAIGAAIGALGGPIGIVGGAVIGLVVGVAIGGVTVAANQRASIVHCETNKGCNTLVMVPLDEENIAKTCQNIESIP